MKRFEQEINLLKVLMRSHIGSSDYRSVLGALWSFIGPFLTFAVLYFIFVERFGRHISFFALKLLTGIIVLTFFRNVVQVCMQSVTQSRTIALYTIAPSEIFILAPLIVPLIKFMIEISLCVIISAALGIFRFPALLPAIIIIFLFLAFSLGVGLMLAILNAFASDVREIWSILSPLLIFLSPIFYSFDMLSGWARSILYWGHPINPFILTFQQMVTGGNIPYYSHATFLLAFAFAGIFLILGYALFKRFEKVVLEL
ncbi:MAG: ABC transporter permease [Candidatus Omnitrophica bacterium]|nr:ABC transporter permease [Candidatus Omnitrophota bacterium]